MKIQEFNIQGPKLIFPKSHEDLRGYFVETFKDDWFRNNIYDTNFTQENQSLSLLKGTIRGLHFQKEPFGQGKLVRCIRGQIFDVAVDVRCGSKTYGQWISAILSETNLAQIWIPDGFLHGFCTLEDNCVLSYKVTQNYNPNADSGVAFNDPQLAIDWPIKINDAIVSKKDSQLPLLAHADF